MSDGYFHRLNKETPTRFWINNPTTAEARQAIEAGAIACTTNPSYAAKMVDHPAMRDRACSAIDAAIGEYRDDQKAAENVQLQLVSDIAREFRDLHQQNPARQGFVSMQGNPHTDDDPQRIIDDARALMQVCPNGIAKIPATQAGFEAIRTLLKEDIPIIVTEVMTISQAVYAAELYQNECGSAGTSPAYFVTHITGIYDEWVARWVEEHDIPVDESLVREAGTIVARRLHSLYHERDYPGTILGGGARARRHFTEFVGGEMDITINWKGMAEDLIKDNPEIENRVNATTGSSEIEKLSAQIPAFKLALEEDSMGVDEFASFGPVELFRSIFVDGWNRLVREVETRRSQLQGGGER